MSSWWHTFFDDTYAAIGLDQTSDEARARIEATIDFIIAQLRIEPGHVVLDQCCGIGRLAIPLARRGVRVIGVEQAATYVEAARERAAGLAAEFHAGDAFEFVAPVPCDAGFNWFTSFGYDRDDAVNVRMLHRAHESLRSGGRFALEYVSVPKVLAEYKPAMVERYANDVWLVQEPAIDFAAGMLQGTWTLLHPDGRREVKRSENRAYMPHEIARLFEQAGFVDIDVIDPDGAKFHRASRRCIVVGAKR